MPVPSETGIDITRDVEGTRDSAAFLLGNIVRRAALLFAKNKVC